MNRNLLKVLISLSVSAAAVQNASASGFEKSTMFGARYGGVAGAGVAGARGADALYYNPAGLVSNRVGYETSLNASPTFSQFKGPIVPVFNYQGGTLTHGGNQETGKVATSVVPSLNVNYTQNEKIGYGIGYFVSAGSQAEFTDVNYNPSTLRGTSTTSIIVHELNAGVGYQIMPKWRAGIGLRYVMSRADFQSLGYTLNAGGTAILNVSNLHAKDLQDNSLAFRLGTQYDLTEKTKLGVSFRSEVVINAKGKIGGVASAAGAIADIDTTVHTVFPASLALAIEHSFESPFTLFGEYGFTQYSRVKKIDIDGLLGGTTAIPSIQTEWKDQHNFRVGGEYTGTKWPIRAGFIWTSSVAEKERARAGFTPPGTAYTFVAGTGQQYDVGGDKKFGFDIAGEVVNVKGDGTPRTDTALDSPAGEYSARAYSVHLGANYQF